MWRHRAGVTVAAVVAVGQPARVGEGAASARAAKWPRSIFGCVGPPPRASAAPGGEHSAMADEAWEDDDFNEFRAKPASSMESDDDDEFAGFGVPAADVPSSTSAGAGATDDFAFGPAASKPPAMPLDDDDDEFR